MFGKIRIFHLLMFILVIGLIYGIKLLFFGGAGQLLFLPGLGDSKSCEFDSDCVPAQCCHPTSAVNRENAPECSDVVCDFSCKPGTLDCGQGRIQCINNRCEAIINE